MSAKRDLLIRTALELFNKYGFHAVGIDTILQESNISKKTLYNHFPSKNDLILATIRYYDETFRNFLVKEIDKIAKTPVEKILSIFNVAEIWFRQNSFHGCVVVKAAGEFSEIDEAIRRSCQEFKRLISEYVTRLASEAKLQAPEILAKKVCLILEGSITIAYVNKDYQIASLARSMASKLIEEHKAQ